MRILHLAGATSVSDPIHGEAHAGPDGVFELPQPFADHLLKTAAGTWRGEADHLAALARQELEELRDPRVALHALSDLRARVQSLEIDVAALKGPPADVEEPQTSPPDDGGASADGQGDPELTPAQKAAATRAANKAAAEAAAAAE